MPARSTEIPGLDFHIETIVLPTGETVELIDGSIIAVTSAEGEITPPPAEPAKLKSSSVATNFGKVATKSIFIGSMQRPREFTINSGPAC